MKNKFISFEGGEGSGKTTQSKKLCQYLIAQGHEAIWTREIGGTAIGEKIREIVVNEELLPQTELLMIMAARNEHLEKVIKPALNEGKYVICDRFIDSTAVYQASSIEEIKNIYQLNQYLFAEFSPSLTFYMKIDPEIALKRAMARGDINKFEKKDLLFHKKIAANYSTIAQIYSDRIVEIEANADVDEIYEEIVNKLNRK